ncbi:MAG TPA: R3H domain-containing nucleic acid-binding protein [Solirubrobacteraceae bacterium]|jgi:spoIIIJ-associated protein|nr:R3H domain-containing nucleic acid-binding protein [Solirubrobacteraceae bacterium]
MSDLSEPPAAIVEDLLTRIAVGLDIDASVEVEETPETIEARYEGDDLGVLIGHHGSLIDAIQHLAYRIAFRGGGPRKQVSVDAGGYRERRAVGLRSAGDQAAETAIREGRAVSLDPMPALERKVVHEHLKTRHDVETYSEGQEPSRHLVVAPLVD